MLGHRLAPALVAALVAAGFAAPAELRAQDVAAPCLLCAAPVSAPGTAEPPSPIRLDVQSRLEFDSIVFNGEGEASMTLSPQGSAQILGAASATGARAMPGTITIRGEPGRQVRIDVPTRIDLFGEYGGSVQIDRIMTDLPNFPRIGDDGTLSFRFGGEIRLTGETDGNYRAAIDFLVEYL